MVCAAARRARGAGAEHEGGDGAKPASSAHPRRALPPRIPAGMPGFDGRGGGVRHGWGRRASASAGLNGRRHASFPGGGHLIGALRFLFPPRWLSQRERAARVLTAEPQVTMHAAGCRRLPSLAVLQKRGWVSAHNQQQPDHICCCSSSSARRVWPRDSMEVRATH